jgi:anaerobic ribonucleoside-triphosphate reductase activating protein
VNYCGLKTHDIADGPGVRVGLFVSGCRHHCEGCFQPATWSFTYGQPYTEETEKRILDFLDNPLIDGLTLLGGEPMEPENQRGLLPFLRRVRAERPGKTIWLYSGFTWEELTEGPSRGCIDITRELLSLVDVLVDGRFVLAQKDITLRFRGSANQRIIDVPTSLEAGGVVLWQDERIFSTHEW